MTATATEHNLARTLDNGLRVRTAPVGSVTAAGVALHYGVGFRSDPVAYPGMAHLVEHLMFQGAGSGESDHFTWVEAMGGFCNASTRQDYTDYYTIVPSDHLDDVMSLEARRIREPRVTEAGLRTQINVIGEEIGAKSRRPYGRFPWPLISPVLFDAYPNAHDGYGDTGALAQADLSDCLDFFHRFYTPSNAVLTISGDIDPERALDLAETHFGSLPALPAPDTGDAWEPVPDRLRTGTAYDPLATRPGFALGYRAPDASLSLTPHFALSLVADILTSGPDPLLARVARERTGEPVSVSARSGLFDFLDARDPDMWILSAIHPEEVSGDLVLDLVDTEIRRLAEHGVDSLDLTRARARRLASFHRKTDQLGARTRVVGRGELLFGDGDLPRTIHRGFTEATEQDVADAARWLTREGRALLYLSPEGKDTP